MAGAERWSLRPAGLVEEGAVLLTHPLEHRPHIPHHLQRNLFSYEHVLSPG